MRIPRFLALLSLATLILCAASFADSTFDFSTKGSGDLGSAVETFTGAGGGSITLWGFSASGVSTTGDVDLYYKANPPNSGDEVGLGLANDPTDHEVGGKSFIQFTAAGITSVTIGSIQSGESFVLYGSNTPGAFNTINSIASGIGPISPQTITGLTALSSGFTYIDLFAPAGNVLLDSATFVPAVPEPGTTAMILTLGIVGLFEVGRRKLMA